MPLPWDLFISREKIANEIADLEEKRDNLRKNVNIELIKTIKEEYPTAPYKRIARQYRKEITNLKNSLYNEFLEEINRHLRFFYSIRQDNLQADLQPA